MVLELNELIKQEIDETDISGLLWRFRIEGSVNTIAICKNLAIVGYGGGFVYAEVVEKY